MKKINEIRLTSPDGVCVMKPTLIHLIVNGKSVNVGGPLAADIWKAISQPAQKFMDEMKDWKPQAP